MKNELVFCKNHTVFCDSRMIAEKFGKQHHHVMQKIEKLTSEMRVLDSENLRTKNNNGTEWFNPRHSEYRGQKFKYYEMNRPAFSLLAMSFTGKKALSWRRSFNDAFYQMEQVLLQQNNLEWKRTREQGKQIRLNLTDEIKSFVDYAVTQGSRNASKYYITITKMQYKALGLIEKNEKVNKDFRGTLDMMDLNHLIAAENVARKALQDGISQELHYKDIYQLAKQNVLQLAKIMVMPPNREIAYGGNKKT